MIYIEGFGYVDETSYGNIQKNKTSMEGDAFDSILDKETIVYAMPELEVTKNEQNTRRVVAPAELEQYFQDAADTYGVDIQLLKAVAKQESNFDPTVVSSAGAVGIMQLMPSTAAELGVTNSYDPRENIMGGAKYLSQLLDTFQGDVSLSLAAYNAGTGNVKKYGGIPPFEETQNYVQNVLAYMGQELTLSDVIYAVSQAEPENNANTIYAVASKDATQTGKIYSIYSKPETL